MIQPESVLLTDLYQLTMLHGYHQKGLNAQAVFEFFVRKRPPHRNFFVAAGLEQLIDYLESFQLTEEECAFLADSGRFSQDFVDYLARLRFTGDVEAMPEGTLFFPDEPVVRVTAPLPEAQVIETRLINLLQFQIMIASKAVRCVLIEPDKLLVDFGLRRAHGAEAGLLAARACYLIGFAGSSNVLATQRFGIPMYGTMAHSYIMAHENEMQAFESFARAQPDNLTLLIDTYDTLACAEKVVHFAAQLAKRGLIVKAVRLDSGNVQELSKKVRQILDEGGFPAIQIFVSGDLDEYALNRFKDNQAPIDGFGVGTKITTCADFPYLNCAYKLKDYVGIPRRKWSRGKRTLPGAKQVFRQFDAQGMMQRDLLTLADEVREGEALLKLVMRGGRRLAPGEPLETIRKRVAGQLMQLPPALKAIDQDADYPVEISEQLDRLVEETDQFIREHN